MRWLMFVAFIVFPLLIVGCSDRVRLQGGYEVVRLDYENRAIVDSKGGMIVYPDIQSCKIRGNFIIGTRIENSQYPVLLPKDIPKEHHIGYFVLNLNNGKLFTGLGREEAEAMVKEVKPDSNCMPRAFWTTISFGLFK